MGMLMKRLSRQQPGYSHLTHETLQESSKVGVRRGGKTEAEELLFMLLWWSAQQKHASKLFLHKTQNCTEKTLPNLYDLFYSKLCHCCDTMHCLPERQVIVKYIQQGRLDILIQFRIGYIVSLENNFHLVQHKMS